MGFGFWVLGFGFWVWGLGFGVLLLSLRGLLLVVLLLDGCLGFGGTGKPVGHALKEGKLRVGGCEGFRV